MELLELGCPEDWERVNVLSRQVSALHAELCPNAFTVEDPAYPRKYFLKDIEEKNLYVARMGDSVVGYVLFRIWETNGSSVVRKMLSIDDIVVEETLRNQGIGQRMMADLKQLAKDRGCNDLQLFVIVQNKNAIAYYEKCGFHISNLGMQMKL